MHLYKITVQCKEFDPDYFTFTHLLAGEDKDEEMIMSYYEMAYGSKVYEREIIIEKVKTVENIYKFKYEIEVRELV